MGFGKQGTSLQGHAKQAFLNFSCVGQLLTALLMALGNRGAEVDQISHVNPGCPPVSLSPCVRLCLPVNGLSEFTTFSEKIASNGRVH